MYLFRVMTGLVLCLLSALAQPLDIRPYSAAALQAAQQSGKPVALHFHASWCPTCRAQEKSFKSLQPDKRLDMTLLVVDYDKERALRNQLGVRVQSMVIVYRGHRETARSGGETSPEKLRAALASAL